MDESRRMCMGMSSTAQHLPRRKSMEKPSFSMNHVTMVMAGDNLDADDFSDVFGGPPRSVLCKKLSLDFTRPASFYEEVFWPSNFNSSYSMKGGRRLSAFRIPAKGEGFYSDIFGSDNDLRRSRERSRSTSKAKSKSNSSSALSPEELSPIRSVVGDDVGLSSLASKLRPINVPCRWNSTTMAADHEPEAKQQWMPAFPSNLSYMEKEFIDVDNFMRRSSSYYGFRRRSSSPEINSLEPHSLRSFKIPADDDWEFNYSPSSSSSSSLCREPEARPGVRNDSKLPEEDDEDEDEVLSSYVIEINGAGEAVSIDEAVAWAKERFNTASSEIEHVKDQQIGAESHESFNLRMNGHGTMQSPLEEEQKKWKAEEEENEGSEEHIKMGVLDEDVKLWSSGNENDIRMLLSTLHNILWANSGWQMFPLTSLKESSQVKKAYQRARLCLHPDKLQQRGATLSQKYVADKAFSILQDAWAAFISQDMRALLKG